MSTTTAITPSTAEALAAATARHAAAEAAALAAERDAAEAAGKSGRLIASVGTGGATPEVDDLVAADAAADRAARVAAIRRAAATAALRDRERAQIAAWAAECAAADSRTREHYAAARAAAAAVDAALDRAREALAELRHTGAALMTHSIAVRGLAETIAEAVATNETIAALAQAQRPKPRPVVILPAGLQSLTIEAMAHGAAPGIAVGHSVERHVIGHLPAA
jgi:hypothetical protein